MSRVTALILCSLAVVVGAAAGRHDQSPPPDDDPWPSWKRSSQDNVKAELPGLKDAVARDADVDFDPSLIDDLLTTLVDKFEIDSTAANKIHLTRSNLQGGIDDSFRSKEISVRGDAAGDIDPSFIIDIFRTAFKMELSAKNEAVQYLYRTLSTISPPQLYDGLNKLVLSGRYPDLPQLAKHYKTDLEAIFGLKPVPTKINCTTTTKPPAITSGPPAANTDCGMLPIKDAHSKRIVGGNETDPNEWPSICSLQLVNSSFHFCGGTLVKNSAGRFYVISAAHCMWKCRDCALDLTTGGCKEKKIPKLESDFKVVCGVHSVVDKDSPDHSQTFQVAKYIIHHNYDNERPYKASDIAVIELDHQPTENNYVQAACLPDTGHTPEEMAVVAGWGTTVEGDNNSTSKVLHELYKPIDNDEYCKRVYNDYVAFLNVLFPQRGYNLDTARDNAFCAGHREGGRDSCQGDSGGPLYTKRNDRWTLTGVVSFGIGCGRKDFVGVYADVYRLRSWINSKINN